MQIIFYLSELVKNSWKTPENNQKILLKTPGFVEFSGRTNPVILSFLQYCHYYYKVSVRTEHTLCFQHWFTRLPAVLKFMLSRFHFNQSTGRAEKIHERFGFDRVVYMDR